MWLNGRFLKCFIYWMYICRGSCVVLYSFCYWWFFGCLGLYSFLSGEYCLVLSFKCWEILKLNELVMDLIGKMIIWMMMDNDD